MAATGLSTPVSRWVNLGPQQSIPGAPVPVTQRLPYVQRGASRLLVVGCLISISRDGRWTYWDDDSASAVTRRWGCIRVSGDNRSSLSGSMLLLIYASCWTSAALLIALTASDRFDCPWTLLSLPWPRLWDGSRASWTTRNGI